MHSQLVKFTDRATSRHDIVLRPVDTAEKIAVEAARYLMVAGGAVFWSAIVFALLVTLPG